jgi:hypothetical protein
MKQSTKIISKEQLLSLIDIYYSVKNINWLESNEFQKTGTDKASLRFLWNTYFFLRTYGLEELENEIIWTFANKESNFIQSIGSRANSIG